jgi:hypothetical protein
MSILTRRQMLMASAAGLGLAATPRVYAASRADLLPQELVSRARAAFATHTGRVPHGDRIAVVDFSRPSSDPRLFLVDLASGRATAHLVAHGRGSDPAHTGWVERFSNAPGSFASSAGAYVTGDEYDGKHGRSMHLLGLDAMNSNAQSRAIVIHAASYVSDDLARETGKIGRSEGCFAVARDDLDAVLRLLGPGRLLFADKL